MPRTKKTEKIDEELKKASKSTAKSTKATTKKGTAGTKKADTKATSKTASKKAVTKTSSTSTAKKTTTRKKASTTAETNKKNTDTKTASNKKKSTKKIATTSEATKTTKEATSSATRRTSNVSSKKLIDVDIEKDDEVFHDLPEYYDLPYRYNNTVVTVLAQNPSTLFVYWDVSDEDSEDLKRQYGENFFEITKPVLLVHNLTDNYTFEVDVNDFANNWYINVNDSKCNYSVELCRRPIYENKIQNRDNNEFKDIINISYSNTIEIPNDHILFFKNGQKIYFKNIKTNNVIEKVYTTEEHKERLQSLYQNFNLSESEDRFDFNNPSSNNPTSNIM